MIKIKCYCPDLPEEQFDDLDLKELDISGKSFYVSNIPMISHFPVNPERKIEKMLAEIDRKGYTVAAPPLVLFEDGMLMGRAMVEIVNLTVKDENVMQISNVKLLGKNFTGPKFLVPKALKQFDGYLMSKDILSTKFYFWYHSCKKCEKEKGSRTIIFGKIS